MLTRGGGNGYEGLKESVMMLPVTSELATAPGRSGWEWGLDSFLVSKKKKKIRFNRGFLSC